jgi:hypothetical protein
MRTRAHMLKRAVHCTVFSLPDAATPCPGALPGGAEVLRQQVDRCPLYHAVWDTVQCCCGGCAIGDTSMWGIPRHLGDCGVCDNRPCGISCCVGYPVWCRVVCKWCEPAARKGREAACRWGRSAVQITSAGQYADTGWATALRLQLCVYHHRDVRNPGLSGPVQRGVGAGGASQYTWQPRTRGRPHAASLATHQAARACRAAYHAHQPHLGLAVSFRQGRCDLAKQKCICYAGDGLQCSGASCDVCQSSRRRRWRPFPSAG